MATEGGPKIVSDGLVLCLDAANVKSFRGEPTANLNKDPLHQTRSVGETINLKSWGGDTGYGEFVSNDSPVGGGFAFINHNTSDPAGSGGTYTDFPSQRYTLENGKTYTRSWYMKASKKQTISGHICSSNKDSDNTYIVGGSVEVTTTWKRYYHTFTYTGPTSSDWQFRHINYKNNSIWIANVQLEEKDHPTKFVDGTRGTKFTTGGGWADRSGNDNHGELVNGPTFDSGNLGGIEFDGIDDRIDIQDPGYPLLGTDPVSIEIIFKIPSGVPWYNGGSGTGLIGRGSYGGSLGIIRRSVEGRIQFWVRLNGGNIYNPSVSNLSRDVYHHIIGTYDGVDTAKVYHNGVFVSQEVNSNNNGIFDSGIFRMGGGISFGGSFGGYGAADIPKTNVYNRVLTPQEILQNYNATKSRFGL